MTPKDILQDLLEKEIVPKLQLMGFNYSSSLMKFSKKSRDGEIITKQTLQFSLDKNTSKSMHFWTMWNVILENATTKEVIKNGSADWNIPGWYTPDGKDSYGKFDFTNPEKRSEVIKDLLEKIEKSGIPYLNKFSDWQTASEEYQMNIALIKKQNNRF